MITIDHVEELIRNSKSSYFFRHSCATEQDKQELAQKILEEIVIPLTNIARKPRSKHDGVQVELPFGTTVKSNLHLMDDYQ